MTDLINGISSEVWQVLGAVKTEFGKFGKVLDAVSKKLEQAQNEITQTGVRSRAIEKQLRAVESLPVPQAEQLLGELSAVDDEPADPR